MVSYKILEFARWRHAHVLEPERVVEGAPWHFVVMTMVRECDRYLLDWVKFHSEVGAAHFFIYVNEDSLTSLTRIRDLLKVNEVSGRVTLIHWPEARLLIRQGSRANTRRHLPTMHEAACMHFRKNFAEAAIYYMKLDSDEYLFRTDFDSAGLDIRPLLDFHGNLFVTGFNFGSSGQKDYISIPDPCRFTRRSPTRNWRKSISHTATTQEFFNTHMAAPLPGISEPSPRSLQINHYRIRSLEEYRRNKLTGRGTIATDYSLEDFSALDSESNQVVDLSACHAFRLAESSWNTRTQAD